MAKLYLGDAVVRLCNAGLTVVISRHTLYANTRRNVVLSLPRNVLYDEAVINEACEQAKLEAAQ